MRFPLPLINLARSLFLVFLALAPVLAADKQPITDGWITDQVLVKLASDRDVGGAGMQVDVHNGAVTLKGKVQHPRQKTKAERLAKKVKGVTSVDNQIVVGEK